MFGLSFGEVVLLLVVGIVVIGPRNMPQAMRSLGRTMGKIRRMTNELREQSGIDEILRSEGIEREMNELRKIATGRIMDVDLYDEESAKRWKNPPRNREYPTGGVDTYGALPEDASPYLIAMSTEQEGRVARGAAVDDAPLAPAVTASVEAPAAAPPNPGAGEVLTPAEIPQAKASASTDPPDLLGGPRSSHG